jgi:predicted acyl esterase
MAGDQGSAEVGSLYYFAEQQRHGKNADHTLLIGAYDASTMLDRPVDSVVHVDLRELRFRWFDHLLKGAERPSLLKDRVNYVVTGANEWRHAPSLEAMANGSLKLYLETGGGEPHRLLPEKPANAPPLPQTVNLADRGDASWTAQTDIVSERVPLLHGAKFVSDPLPQATEVAGLLSGQLDFKVNKLDMDLYIALYEQQPDGEYLRVLDPYEFRASYAKDRTRRQLLRVGKRQQLAFRSEQVMSRRLQQGSRLVLVLGVDKRPDREINHGSGKAVSEESAADGTVPLKLEWFADSTIDVPVRR